MRNEKHRGGSCVLGDWEWKKVYMERKSVDNRTAVLTFCLGGGCRSRSVRAAGDEDRQRAGVGKDYIDGRLGVPSLLLCRF